MPPGISKRNRCFHEPRNSRHGLMGLFCLEFLFVTDMWRAGVIDVNGQAAAESSDRDLLAVARVRVRKGPTPEWVEACAYDNQFNPALRTPLTHLLIERQVHAELRQSFVRTAVRLETMHAVQHCSQWRLDFEPQTT